MSGKREDAISAFHLLNGFVGDLAAGSQVRRLFMSSRSSNNMSAATLGCVNRMCLSHLLLALDKWSEFYDHFHRVIPDDCRPACKQLTSKVRRRRIDRFRDTVVGHIWDKKLNRALTSEEIEAASQAIVEGDPDGFVEWCNHPTSNLFPSTVISIVEHTRDRIR